MYACISVRMLLCICVCNYTFFYVCIYVCMNACMYVGVSVFLHVDVSEVHTWDTAGKRLGTGNHFISRVKSIFGRLEMSYVHV